MKNKKLWKLFLVIGIIPFIIPLAYGIYSFFFGFTFIGKIYGFDALVSAIIIWSSLYWITYFLGIILIIISALKIKKCK